MTDLEQSIREIVRSVVRDELEKAKADPSAHLTVDDYAAKWQISPSTVRAAIREKRLEITRIGRAIRIAADARIIPPRQIDWKERARLRLMGGSRVR